MEILAYLCLAGLDYSNRKFAKLFAGHYTGYYLSQKLVDSRIEGQESSWLIRALALSILVVVIEVQNRIHR